MVCSFSLNCLFNFYQVSSLYKSQIEALDRFGQIFSIWTFFNGFFAQTVKNKQLKAMIQSLIGKTIKNYKVIQKIGKGQSAFVFSGVNILSNQPVAIKVIMINIYNSKQSEIVKNKAVMQAAILKSCNNENIIKYIDSFEALHFYFFIVTEFCNQGDLSQYMLIHQIQEPQAIVFLKQILNGFNGLHKIGIMHRDFKAANVLLHNGVCKIADFGLSKEMGMEVLTATNVGTPLTNAPQILQGRSYGFETDIWSIGIVYYQILFQEYPYKGSDKQKILKGIKKGQPNFLLKNKNVSEHSIDFIRRCLKINPKQRISWAQIYKHPLLTSSPTTQKDNANLQFYLTNKLIEMPQIKGQPLQDISISMSKMQLQELKKSLGYPIDDRASEIRQKFEKLYLSRRDDLVFFMKYVQPYIGGVAKVDANHWVFGFIFAKKTYLDLSDMLAYMNKYRSIFPQQQGFETFNRLQSYQTIKSVIKQQQQKSKKFCEKYHQKIKLSTIQVKQEQNIDMPNNCNILLNNFIRQYMKLLGKYLRDSEGEEKVCIVKILRALEYYSSCGKVNASQYQILVDQESIHCSEGKIVKRYSFN